MSPRPHRRRNTIVSLVAIGAVLAGLASGAGASATAKDTPAPEGLPGFYSVPQPLKGKPGTL
ncbi:MAG: hypothetical protein MUP67_12040, partial [Acidimicrobiia bacterium]|nr:hypothetical protein [Acidimicrobiia bacterium]